MTQFLQNVANFAAGTGVLVYLFIFFGKLLEVSIGTLRIVLINRGVKTVGAAMAMVEIMLWLVVASTVLTGFREDWIKGLMYALAYALGNYLGTILDERLAFGLCSVQTVLNDENDAIRVSAALRRRGFGVTTLDVHGRDDDHYMLLMNMKRKRTQEAVTAIEELCPDAVISISDVKTQRHGYLSSGALHHNVFRRIGK